ncbi:MAG TPA: copper homeostasis protein CutC [Chitinophagaceae bacterium]|nr:copper homeostasis protein CutC [Chitinophagaceae bacterium]
MGFIIEIATSDFTTSRSAVEGGADRIELCANLAEGGVTASYGLILRCREQFEVALYPIIRPRGGDFLYTEEEFQVMLQDAIQCRQLGCDGIVTGMLNPDGSLDIKRTEMIAKTVYPLGLTFHRAFDRCSNPFEAMEQLIEIGCERILTSGQKPTAPEGLEFINELNRIGGHRIHIMPGSGVRKENIKELAVKTGCTEFHSSLRGKIKSRMEYIHPAFANDEENYLNNAIDQEEVRALRVALAGNKDEDLDLD